MALNGDKIFKATSNSNTVALHPSLRTSKSTQPKPLPIPVTWSRTILTATILPQSKKCSSTADSSTSKNGQPKKEINTWHLFRKLEVFNNRASYALPPQSHYCASFSRLKCNSNSASAFISLYNNSITIYFFRQTYCKGGSPQTLIFCLSETQRIFKIFIKVEDGRYPKILPSPLSLLSDGSTISQ